MQYLAKVQAMRRANVLTESIIGGVLALVIVWIFNGNPSAQHAMKVTGFNFFIKNIYFVFGLLFLFSFSRTVGVRQMIRFFFVGMVFANVAGIALQLYLLHWHITDSDLFGHWKTLSSVYQASIVAPLTEDTLKFVPVFAYYLMARRKKTVASHSISDWFLLAFSAGAGAGFGENLLRISTSMNSFANINLHWPHSWLDLVLSINLGSGNYDFFGVVKQFGGYEHDIATGLVGLCFGIALAVQMRSTVKSSKQLAWGLSVAAILYAMIMHGLSNLSYTPLDALIRKTAAVKFLVFATWNGFTFPVIFLLLVGGVLVYEYRLLHKSERMQVTIVAVKKQLQYMQLFVKEAASSTLLPQEKNPYKRVAIRFAQYYAIINHLLVSVFSRFTLARIRHAQCWKKRNHTISL